MKRATILFDGTLQVIEDSGEVRNIPMDREYETAEEALESIGLG